MKIFIVVFAIIAAARVASTSTIYLPPVVDNSLPTQEYIPPENNEESALLADDGYRYKVVRKLKQRLRRDVSELPSSEYLPPAEEVQETIAAELSPLEEVTRLETTPEEMTLLADDGYRYKAVRRLKYRKRRDVSESLPNEYLLPSEEIQEDADVSVSVPEEQTELFDDGYHYKTVRRLKYRQRRDVSEIPMQEYLPPSTEIEEDITVADIVPEDTTQLADDGYRYKTIRRFKYRQRRDVNELPASQYLPAEVEKPVSEEIVFIEPIPEVKTELSSDGYRYKTVRRLKHKRH